MIAHRLQTIETAQNLLYIDSAKKIIPAEKGTAEYDQIIQKLKTETYKHQEDKKPQLLRGSVLRNFDTAKPENQDEKHMGSTASPDNRAFSPSVDDDTIVADH